MRMRAAVLEQFGHPLVVQELELAEPRTGEVLVRLVACHSRTSQTTPAVSLRFLFSRRYVVVDDHACAPMINRLARHCRPPPQTLAHAGSLAAPRRCDDVARARGHCFGG